MAGHMVRRVKLVYPARLLDQPILYRLISELGVQVNVLEAEVNSQVGRLTIEMAGTPESVISASEWLTELGVDVSDASHGAI